MNGMVLMKQRLDHEMARRGLVESRSQAESWIKLGKVRVDGELVTKSGHFVRAESDITLTAPERYVSRAGLKLSSVVDQLGVSFEDAVVLDVGSSTGGFTDYALQHGASYVYAVDVGTDQMHYSLLSDERVESHEKTDIRNFVPGKIPDVVVIDVSFISLRLILPHIADISGPGTSIIAMVKPQFEAERNQTNKGVIKNETVRRQILRDFEAWAKRYLVVDKKADSDVSGAKGNRERFYKLLPLS